MFNPDEMEMDDELEAEDPQVDEAAEPEETLGE